MRLRTKAPISNTAVTMTSNAKGKSSGSKSKVFEGCTLVKNRSRPYDRVRVVDSKFAGEATIPAQERDSNSKLD